MTSALSGSGKTLVQSLNGTVGSNESGPTVVVAFGDDLEGELGLGRAHGEDGEIVDSQEVCAHVAAQGAVEGSMDVGAVQVGGHARGGCEDDTLLGLAGSEIQSPREEGLAGTWAANEKRIGALGDEIEVVQGKVASMQPLAGRVEIEGIDGIDRWVERYLHNADKVAAAYADEDRVILCPAL